MQAPQHVDVEDKQRARERTQLISDLREGRPVEGLGEHLEKVSKTVEDKLREKGSGPEFRTADVLEAQRRLLVEKDLTERFARIKKRMEDLRGLSARPGTSREFVRIQQELESLRPLVLLLIRSAQFRELLFTGLRLAKKVIERNQPKGGAEKIASTTEKRGFAAGAREVNEQARQFGEKIHEKVKEEKLLSDEEWTQLSDKIDVLVRDLQRHGRYRDGITQLFQLASHMRTQFNETVRSEGSNIVNLSRREENAVYEIKREALGVVQEFSGAKALDDTTSVINNLYRKIENNEKVEKWWEEFKTHTEKILKNYKSKEDLEVYRKLFNEGYEIFEKFSDDIDAVIDNLSTLIDNIANDKLVRDLREKVGSLTDELVWTDNQGNPNVDTAATKSLVAAITEAFREEFRYLALPGIRMRDDDSELILEDVIISATLPDNISFHLESYANFDTRTLDLSTPGKPADLGTELYLTVKVKDVTFATHDTRFQYKGMIDDSGVFSLCIPKPGATLTVDFVLRPFQMSDLNKPKIDIGSGTEESTVLGQGEGRYSFVKVNSNIEIPDLDIYFKKETMNHPHMIPMFTTLFKRSLISDLENIMERLLNEGLKKLGEGVAQILNKAQYPLSLPSLSQLSRKGMEAFVE